MKTIFDYSVLGPYRGWQKPRKHFTYRVVLDDDGYPRVDKRGIKAKAWKSVTWGGSLEGHYALAVCECRKDARYWNIRERGMP